jgi:hypothetical protein
VTTDARVDEEFEPPAGTLIVATVHGEPVAGGAFRRNDAETAELKRIWAASGHRRRGYEKIGRHPFEKWLVVG